MFSYWLEWVPSGTLSANSFRGKVFVGEIAWVAMLVIFVTSLNYFRRKYFDFFYLSHFVFVGYFFFGILHQFRVSGSLLSGELSDRDLSASAALLWRCLCCPHLFSTGSIGGSAIAGVWFLLM